MNLKEIENEEELNGYNIDLIVKKIEIIEDRKVFISNSGVEKEIKENRKEKRNMKIKRGVMIVRDRIKKEKIGKGKNIGIEIGRSRVDSIKG